MTQDTKGLRKDDRRRRHRTSLSVRVGVDLADQEAALVELAVSLLGHAHQWVPSAPQPFHSVGGRVSSDVSQFRHRLPQLLLITAADEIKKTRTFIVKGKIKRLTPHQIPSDFHFFVS